MSNWVKFSDRMPTEADADIDGNVFIRHVDSTRSATYLGFIEQDPDHKHAMIASWSWLENVPQPRTLEDVVREFLSVRKIDRRLKLQKEMREILEKGKGK